MWNPFRRKAKASDYKTAVLRALAQMVPGATGFESAFRLDQFSDTITKSCWLFSAVYRIANVLASTKIRVVERDTNRDAKGRAADDLRRLFRKVNLDDSAYDFKQGLFVHKLLDGEWAAHKARDAMRRVREMHLLLPAQFRLLADKTGRRRIGGMVWWGGGQDITIPREEFIYCRTYNPSAINYMRGMSPTAPLKRELEWDLAAARFNVSLIAEGMRIGGILMPKEGYTPNPDEWEQLKTQLRGQNMGARNAGRFLALSAPFDFKPDGMVPADMEMMEGRKMVRDMSAAVTGASPMMMQNFDAASFANGEIQIRQFWDHVGKPELIQSFQALTEQLVEPDFGEDLEVCPDYAGIDAQIDSEKTRVENARSLLLGGEVHVLQGANLVLKPGEWKNLVTETTPPKPPALPGAGTPPGDPMASPNSADQIAPGQLRAASAVRRLNGQAEPILEWLTSDMRIFRNDVADGHPDPTGIGGSTREVILKAIGDLAGRSVGLGDPKVRQVMTKCGEVASSVQRKALADLGQVKGDDALRARCMDPETLARLALLDMSEAIVEAAGQ